MTKDKTDLIIDSVLKVAVSKDDVVFNFRHESGLYLLLLVNESGYIRQLQFKDIVGEMLLKDKDRSHYEVLSVFGSDEINDNVASLAGYELIYHDIGEVTLSSI